MTRILLADDDPMTLQSLQDLLTLEGFEVTSAQDGIAALSRVDEGLFDLEQGPIPEAKPHKELARTTGYSRLVKELKLLDHDLVA